ncbi:hypothetical protein Ancab_018257 [Ancistrocladus abbreviatus]
MSAMTPHQHDNSSTNHLSDHLQHNFFIVRIQILQHKVSGNPCNSLSGQQLSDNQLHQKQNQSSGTMRQLQRGSHVQKPFASLEAARLEDLEEESSYEFSELFHGFLAIGTLGAGMVISEPETPTFAISIEKIAERETEVTENELKLINDELEKVLGAEAKDDSWTDSSGRNSHVSNGRSSHASTITLISKTVEIPEANINGNEFCPLQGYLFGSAVELPEKAIVMKEHGMSLGQLFQRQKAEEDSGIKVEREEKRTYKEGDKTAMNIMKKILKRKFVNASSRSSSTNGEPEAASAETRLRKMLHKFHKKVHPESSTSVQKLDKPRKIGIKNIISYHSGHNNGGQVMPDEDITMLPHGAIRKSCMQPQYLVGRSDSNGNRECWIKTDADYLVLEL